MNLQQILAPIEDLFMWSFGLLEAGNNYVNYLIMITMFIALVYWTLKLASFQKDEVPNR